MIRTFSQHKVRKQEELSQKLWKFVPLGGEHQGMEYQAAVPGCWENLPGFSSYRGEGMYSTTFEAGGNVRLEFKGVSHTAEVFVDGEKVASHYNAYTAFDALVHLEKGVHTLQVKADNRFSEASALHVPNDYMSYGGITRPVVLEEVADIYVKWVHVTPKRVCAAGSVAEADCQNGEQWKWKADVAVCLNNVAEEQPAAVSVELAGETFTWAQQALPAGESVVSCEMTFDGADIKEWMPKQPNLYDVYVTVLQDGEVIDDLVDRVGFREVTVEDGKIKMNGRALRIKGFCRHEDHPQFGCAIPYSAIAYDLNTIRDLGANSVRTSHYPNDEIFLDLCDEMGILVWEENHARGLSEEQMRNPNFERQAEEVIREMIPLHYNHPSIYIWGILNECASETEYGKECYEKQYAIIKELDTSRLRSSASCKFKTDLCFGTPEVVSYNIYPQWYHDAPADEYLADLYRWVQEETGGKGKPFLITEIGAGAIYGYRNPNHDKWTEEYQAEALEKQIHTVMNQPGCQGMYIWQYCDVRISREWFSTRPRTMNNKGIVDEYRRPKLSYDVVKKMYSALPDYMD